MYDYCKTSLLPVAHVLGYFPSCQSAHELKPSWLIPQLNILCWELSGHLQKVPVQHWPQGLRGDGAAVIIIIIIMNVLSFSFLIWGAKSKDSKRCCFAQKQNLQECKYLKTPGLFLYRWGVSGLEALEKWWRWFVTKNSKTFEALPTGVANLQLDERSLPTNRSDWWLVTPR